MVDVENEYIENDEVMKDMVEEMVIDMADDSGNEEEKDLIDDSLDRVLEQGTSTQRENFSS